MSTQIEGRLIYAVWVPMHGNDDVFFESRVDAQDLWRVLHKKNPQARVVAYRVQPRSGKEETAGRS